MKQESLEKMKKLTSFANSAGGFWDRYDKTVEKPSCDKYEAKFNGDSRFPVFKVKSVQFNALTGYYGNSGCTTFGSMDDELASLYFVKAINSLKRQIFAEMERFAKDDASSLHDSAKKELDELQKMVESSALIRLEKKVNHG